MRVQFKTRPGYGEMGDLVIDGEDLGWHSLEEADLAASEAGVELEVIAEADYVVRNPRRETEDGDQ